MSMSNYFYGKKLWMVQTFLHAELHCLIDDLNCVGRYILYVVTHIANEERCINFPLMPPRLSV